MGGKAYLDLNVNTTVCEAACCIRWSQSSQGSQIQMTMWLDPSFCCHTPFVSERLDNGSVLAKCLWLLMATEAISTQPTPPPLPQPTTWIRNYSTSLQFALCLMYRRCSHNLGYFVWAVRLWFVVRMAPFDHFSSSHGESPASHCFGYSGIPNLEPQMLDLWHLWNSSRT